jgi:hypothetical protein
MSRRQVLTDEELNLSLGAPSRDRAAEPMKESGEKVTGAV